MCVEIGQFTNDTDDYVTIQLMSYAKKLLEQKPPVMKRPRTDFDNLLIRRTLPPLPNSVKAEFHMASSETDSD